MGYKQYSPGYDRRSHHGRHSNDSSSEEIFEKFNSLKFWELQQSIRKNREAINNTHSRIQNRFSRFSEWDEKEMLRNAAIVAAKAVVDDVRTTQVRRIIEMAKDTHVKLNLTQESVGEKIESEIQFAARRMMMLLAYTAGKNKNVSTLTNSLQPILAWLLENPSRENFNRVYEFFEAIISYHRYFGGRE